MTGSSLVRGTNGMTSRVQPLRRRWCLTCCDNLVCGLAREFGHVIEFEREGADAGGRRADLDDEVADFRFWHLGAHRVPALPALAGVEAENLAATTGEDRVHLGGGFRRADDLDQVDRLE